MCSQGVTVREITAQNCRCEVRLVCCILLDADELFEQTARGVRLKIYSRAIERDVLRVWGVCNPGLGKVPIYSHFWALRHSEARSVARAQCQLHSKTGNDVEWCGSAQRDRRQYGPCSVRLARCDYLSDARSTTAAAAERVAKTTKNKSGLCCCRTAGE